MNDDLNGATRRDLTQATIPPTTIPMRRRRLFAAFATLLLGSSVFVQTTNVVPVSAEAWELQLGPLNSFPRSGTAPFDATTAAPVPPPFTSDQGNDANNTNNVIRSQDVQTYVWSMTGANVDGDAGTITTINNVTLEQIITPNAPLTLADLTVEPLNVAECPGAGSGIVVDTANNRIVVTCNTGTYTTGDQTAVTVRVQPGGTAPNGSSFTSTQRVYATEGDGNPTQAIYDLDTHPQGDTIYITNRPEWNLSKHGFYGGSAVTRDPDGSGPEPEQRGIQVGAVYQISSARPFGNEALVNPITVHDVLSFTDNSGNNIVYPAEYYPMNCNSNGFSFPGVVWGYSGGLYGVDSNYTNCESSFVRDGDATSGFEFTFPTVNFNPASYPTVYPGGSGSLAAGPFYVASIYIEFFIPRDSIDLADGVLGNGGTTQLFNAVGDFDPASVSGGSNFNTGVEPGYCTATESGLPAAPNGGTGSCDLMPDTTRSDNVIGPTPFTYTEPGIDGGLSKDTYRQRYTNLPGQTYNKGNDGLVEPTMQWFHRVYSYNNSLAPQRGYICDVFDNSTARLTALGEWMNPDTEYGIIYNGDYASVSSEYGGAYLNTVVEYGHVDLSTVDPLSGGYNALTDRYIGDWTALNTAADAGCDDADTTWYTNPNDLPNGGIDQVNIVRARPANATVDNVPSQQNFLMIIPLESRNTFYGGPNNGQPIPDGTVIANRSNRLWEADPDLGLSGVNWYGDDFSPEPFVFNYQGERVTLRRATIAMLKRSIDDLDTGYTDTTGTAILTNGGADYGVTGNAVAGDYVAWEMTPTLVSELGSGSAVDNVTLTDVLPAGVDYDPICTAAITGGTPATTVALNTPNPGETTLTWLLGSVVPNTDLGVFRICTQIDDFAANGQAYTNTATFSATGLGSVTDYHVVNVAQGTKTKIKKTVDAPLDLLNDEQVWTTTIRNFSPIVQTLAPKMLEVFPYIGDATSINGGLRNPASDFDGTNTLTTMPTATYLDGSTSVAGSYIFTADNPATIDQNPDSNLAGNLTNWCSTSDGGSTWAFVSGPGSVADCPASLAEVTAFLFTAGVDLTESSNLNESGITIRFELQADSNTPDNIYTNRFTADSATFPTNQYLRSNIVTVRTVGFQLGDYVWADANGDGRLNAGESPVPDGVTVQLYADDDGTPGPSASDTLLGSQDTVGGTYQFTGLDQGDFYVRIPASEFQAGGTLVGWDITGATAEAPNADLNDTAGHDGLTAGVATTGITSTVVTLSAQYVGDNLVGDEPTADNTHGLTADPFQDGFQNFTVDLAVVGPPAIELIKEVCTDSTGVACTVGNDAAWDDVSAFVDYGSTAYWRITVTNTGAQDLFPVAITDPVTPSCATNLGTPLKVGQSASIVCSGAAVTETAAAPRVNTAFVNANPQGYDPTNTDPSDNLTDNDPAQISTAYASIGDYVWVDVDRDGQQDAGEPVRGGVVVELLDASGNAIDPDGAGPGTRTLALTDSNGFYSFVNLDPGTAYIVDFTLPAGFEFTTALQGAAATDSNANVITGEASVTTPTTGLTNSPTSPDDPTIDAGLISVDLTIAKTVTSTGPYFAGSTVTFSLVPHNNGPSAALAGWSVTDILPNGLTLVSMTGTGYNCVANVCTDTSGVNLAADADGAAITVTATINSGFSGTAKNVTYITPAGTEITETNPLVIPTTSTDTSSSPTNNDAQASITVGQLVSIGDYVWRDDNRNGQQDSGEPVLSGIIVELLDASGNAIDPDGAGPLTQTIDITDSNGFYSFTSLLPSTDYQVVFAAPADAGFTSVDTGADATDSDADPVTGIALVTTPSGGSNSAVTPDDPTIDAGLVYIDLTVAKSVTSAGPYYAGSTVEFELVPTNNGPSDALAGWSVTDILPSGLTLVSMTGTGYNCVATTCTDTSGVNLAAGDSGAAITVVATVNVGFKGVAHNVTYVSPVAGDVPETNVLVIPTTSTDTDSTGTNNDAQASVTVQPLISIGDYVWRDIDRDGVQDSGEPAVAGVTVELLTSAGASIDPDGSGPLTSTTAITDANGFYSFTGLLPSTDYQVQFTAPAGTTFTTPNVGVDTTDSDANVTTGIVSVTTPADGNNLTATPDDPTIDAGIVSVDLTITKTVTSSGPYFAGYTVTFSLVPHNNGPTEALPGWSVTDILPAGLTLVSMTGTGYNCAGLVCTDTSGVNLGVDADGAPITVTATINSGFRGVLHNVTYITPAGGEVTETNPLVIPTTSTDTDETGTNNDAQASIGVGELVSIGDHVWTDVDRDGVQDAGEPAVAGVTVELLDSSGNSIDPDGAGPLTQTVATTDADGFYSFTGLLPSTDYQVQFTAPVNTVFTTQNSAGSTAANGSDADVITGIVLVTTPASGADSAVTPDDPTIDAGLVSVDLALAKVLTTAGPFFPGKTVSYTLTPSNTGTANALPGWSVTEILPAGMTLVSMVGSAGGSSIYTCAANLCTSSAALAAGGTAETIIVTATIDARVTGVLHNVAYISPAPTEIVETNPLGTPPTTTTNTSSTGTNNDAQADLTSTIVYDLALIKTVDAASIAYDGTATFTVTVANQGNQPSGVFTVTDTLPAGTEFVSASNGGTHTNGVVTWSLTSINAGETVAVTVTVRPVDLTKRPFINTAEITADSADSYSTPGNTVTDIDSVPGDTATSASDNLLISEAGVGADSGFDDEDIASFTVPVTYDLALVKTVPAGQSYVRGSTISFEITVKNQGNVPSGVYTVQDVIPAGMSFVSATDGGTLVGGVVTWTDLASLNPGETKVLTVRLILDDVSLQQYRNVAEISADSAATYSTPSTPVFDKDSTPDFDPNNDPVVDNDDVNIDSISGDEDDHDIALLSITAITLANQAPPAVVIPTTLPTTGSSAADLLIAAGLLLSAGWVLTLGARRRRSPI